MNRPIQVKQTDSENRGGKLTPVTIKVDLILRLASFMKQQSERSLRNVLLVSSRTKRKRYVNTFGITNKSTRLNVI